MQRATSTLKKIFADTLRPEGAKAPLMAWPLACGSKIANRTQAVSYAGGVLTVAVPDRTWRRQLQGLEQQYLAALSHLSVEKVNSIKFVLNRSDSPR